MKISNFVKWQIKKWLPLFIVVFILMFTILSLNGSGVLFSSDSIWIYSVISFMLPFFCFSERFEKGAADAYRAFPAKDKQIKRAKILTMLAFIVVVCTVVYLLSTVVYISEYGNKGYDVSRYNYYEYDKYGMIEEGPSAFLLCYGLMILFTATSFLFNCTLVGLGNYGATSWIYVICGNLLLMLTVPSLILSFGSVEFIVKQANDFKNGIIGAGGILGKAFCVDSILNSAFMGLAVGNVELSTANAVLFTILFIIEIGVGVLGFFLKEPSGEYYSMPGASNELHKIIVYCALGVMYLCVSPLEAIFIESSLFGVIVLMIFIVMTIYAYISLVIFNKRFKLTKKELIIFASIVLGGIIFVFIDYLRIESFINGNHSSNGSNYYSLLSFIK